MPDDAELLRRYASEDDEDAFRELVRRHLSLVYSAALRRTGGDAHRAQDVSQVVFSELARKARTLASHRALAAWLYAATRNVAIKMMLSERRRLAREQEASATEAAARPEVAWAQLRPVLDEAMDELGDRDREAVLLRYFKGLSFCEVGGHLRTSEDTARMRVERALERLRTLLARHGVTSSAAALGVALAEHSASEAPAGLLDGVSHGALTAGGSGGISTPVLAMATVSAGKMSLLAALLALLVALGLIGYRQLRSPSPVPVPVAVGPEAGDLSAAVTPGSENLVPAEPAGPSLPEILAETDEIKGYALFARHLQQMKREEFGGAFQLIIDIPRSERWDTYFQLYMRRWGQVDPRAALAAIDAADIKPFGHVQTVLYQQMLVVRGWAFEDPEAALAWGIEKAGHDLEGPVTDPATRTAARLLTTTTAFTFGGFVEAGGFAEAADFLAANTDLIRRMAGISGSYAGGYSGELTDELRARSAQNAVATLAGQLLQNWVRADATAAARWLSNGFPKQADPALAVAGLVRGIAGEEPDLAANILGSVRDAPTRAAGAAAFVEALNDSGRSTRALEWLAAQTGEGDAAMDKAINSYFWGRFAARAQLNDGESLRPLIQRVVDPALRTETAWAYARARLLINPAESIRAIQQLVPASDHWVITNGGGGGGSGPIPISIPEVVLRWAIQDYDEAVAYVNSMDSVTPEQRASLLREAAKTR